MPFFEGVTAEPRVCETGLFGQGAEERVFVVLSSVKAVVHNIITGYAV